MIINQQVSGVEQLNMSKGFLQALCASALWGLLLVIPEWLADFTPVEIVFGRNLYAGMLVLAVLINRTEQLSRLSFRDILNFVRLSFLGNILFYFLLVISIQAIGIIPACLLIAILPVLSSRYIDAGWNFGTNHDQLFSITLMFMAIFLVISSVGDQMPVDADEGMTLGIITLLMAGVVWCFSISDQIRLIKNKPGFDSSDHFLLTGIGSLPLLLLMLPLMFVESEVFSLFDLHRSNDRWLMFWLMTGGIGLLSTFVARLLWKGAMGKMTGHRRNCFILAAPAFAGIYFSLLSGWVPDGKQLIALVCFILGFIQFYRQRLLT